MLSFRQHAAKTTPDVSHWKQVGHQLGSNPGGVFADEHGNHHYVKFYSNPQQARSEVAAAGIYHLMGLKTLGHRLVSHKGRLGVASSWRNDIHQMMPHHYENLSDHTKDQISKSYMTAVLTKNWDAVGPDFMNIARDNDHNLVHLDMGGVFRFRARGGPKEFGHDIDEAHSLMDPDMNEATSHVFGKAEPRHHAAAVEALRKLDPTAVHEVFTKAGVTNPQEHTDSLMARAHRLIAKFS